MYKINYNTHCSLPWTGFDTRSYNVCCKIKVPRYFSSFNELTNSEEIKKLREDLLNGIKNPWCQECWNEEAAGKTSMRRTQLLKEGQLKTEEYLNDEITNIGIRELILDSGNSCNLACRTCGSYASSTHITEAKSKKIKFPNLEIYKVKRTDVEGLIKEDFSKTHTIEILGGEPFLNVDHFEVLEKVISNGYAKNCTLTYTTNCTQQISKKHLEIMSEFFLVGFILSIDAIGDQFEYIRTGANWNKVLENIKFLKEIRHNFSKSYFLVHPTISVYNVLYLEELYDWILTQEFPMYYDFCFNPREFSFEVLNESQKQKVIDHLANSKHNMQSIINYLKTSTHDTNLVQQLHKELNWTKEYHNMDYIHYLPRLANLLT